MIAETMLGNGERAYGYYAQINPAGKNGLIDLYESEPYVYPPNVLGDEHIRSLGWRAMPGSPGQLHGPTRPGRSTFSESAPNMMA